ncbi:hypothetical protein ACV0BM_004130 [Elizabethkingia meningoseptica]
MKENILNRCILSGASVFITFILCLSIVSCRSSAGESVDTGMAIVKVRINGSNFEDTGLQGTQASVARSITAASATQQIEELKLKGNEEYRLIATLIPVNNAEATPVASSNINHIAATQTNLLGSGIKYKVVVFDSTGNYVKEQDYTSG